MTDLVLNIGLLEALALIVAGAGSLITIAWYAGSRLARVETLLETMDRRLTTIEGNYAGAIQTRSPLELTEKGQHLLIESGLQQYIDESADELIRLARPEDESLDTAYDIQDAAFDFFEDAHFSGVFEKELKEFAFKNGISMQLLRRIAGIYLRDVMLARRDAEHADDGSPKQVSQ